MSKTEYFLKSGLIGLLITLVVFIVTDCSSGKTLHRSSVISGKRFTSEWVEYRQSYNSTTKHYETNRIVHPEQFDFYVVDRGKNIKVSTNEADFFMKKEGDVIHFRVRVGRWTKIEYLNHTE